MKQQSETIKNQKKRIEDVKMKRIVIMFLKNFLFAPFWYIKLILHAKSDRYPEAVRFAHLKNLTIHANRAGRVTIKAYGLENIPKENGYIMFPNHQGLYDVLTLLEVHPVPFSLVMKKELTDIPGLKYVFQSLRAYSIDRKDVRQSMEVMKKITEDVKKGKNYLIFAEGTRSKEGNKLLEFKGGSFKSAIHAKCPILPVALIDSYQVFDTNSIKKQTVQIHYLKPLYYEDYKDLKSTEIAALVKLKIEKKIKECCKIGE